MTPRALGSTAFPLAGANDAVAHAAANAGPLVAEHFDDSVDPRIDTFDASQMCLDHFRGRNLLFWQCAQPIRSPSAATARKWFLSKATFHK